MANKKVLVTGGAGYVGNVVVRDLLSHGYDVRVLDNLIFTDASLRDLRNQIDLRWDDVRKVGPEIMDGIWGVIHLAGISTEPTSQYNPRFTDLLNHIATEKIAVLAKTAGVKHFVFASSCSVYFTYDTTLEPNNYTEANAVNPISPYSLSKRAAEQAILELADENFQPVIFRKGTIYGLSPRMRYDLVVNSFTKDAFSKRRLTVNSGGRLWRPLADIRDVSAAYVKALELPLESIGGKIFNICNENWNIGELAKRMQAVIKEKKNIDIDIDTQEIGITRNYKADNTLFVKKFNYKPVRTMEDAVMEIWDNLEKNPQDAVNPLFYNDKWQIHLLERKQM